MRRKFVIYLLLVFLGIVFFFLYLINTHYESIAGSGLILDKHKSDGYTIDFRMLSDEKRGYTDMTIKVEEEMVWNLIEVGQTYFVAFLRKNQNTPVLIQIEKNPDFYDLYKDRLQPKK